MEATLPLHSEHQLILVMFSIIIAIYSSYTAFHLISRINQKEIGLMKNYWLFAASLSLGCGIWAMHFIGMLAFQINLPVRYDPFLLGLSILFPVIMSFFAFYLLFRSAVKEKLIVSGLIMGFGILVMHYAGIEAMIVKAEIQYDFRWILLSIIIAMLSTTISVQVFALFYNHPVYNKLWAKAAAAIFMGAAISGMHYAGMHATTFLPTPDYHHHFRSGWPEIPSLAIGIGFIIFCLQLFLFISQYIDHKTISRLTESEERYRQLVELSPMGIAIHKNGILTYVNPAGMYLLGVTTPEEAVGQNVLSFIHSSCQETVKKRIKTISEQRKPLAPLEQKVVCANGKTIDMEIMALPIVINGEDHVQLLFQDVTERKKLEEINQYYAYHDPLTGLPNRRLFEESLQNALLVPSVYPRVTAVMFIDLDGFKQVNDLYGHESGDLVLKMVADKLKGIVHETGLVSRLAGDEFTVLLTGLPEQKVLDIAQKILDVLQFPLVIENGKICITPSIGVSFQSQPTDDAASLISKADTAMYESKKTGKNTYRIYRGT